MPKAFLSFRNLILGLTTGMVIWELSTGIPETFQWIFMLGLLAAWGIPHGALDHLVEAHNAQLKQTRFSLMRFLIQYLSWILVLSLVWWWQPVFSLGLFLLVSALHFGETDLRRFSGRSGWRYVSYCLYGMALLSILLLPNLDEAAEILKALGAQSETGEAIMGWLDQQRYVLVFSLSGLALVAFVLVSSRPLGSPGSDQEYRTSAIDPYSGPPLFQPTVRKKWRFIAFSALLWVLLWQLPLFISFSLYFGCWHALQALGDIRRHLSSQSPDWSWTKLARAALPLGLISIVGLFLLAGLGHLFLDPVLLIFIFISTLTVPHALVMDSMYRLKS